MAIASQLVMLPPEIFVGSQNELCFKDGISSHAFSRRGKK